MRRGKQEDLQQQVRRTVYCITLVKAVVTVGFLSAMPSMRVPVFTVARGLGEEGSMARGLGEEGLLLTLKQGRNSTTTHPFHLSPVTIPYSFLLIIETLGLAAFSSLSCALHDQSESALCSNDFTRENLEAASVWDGMFWAYVLFAHGIVDAVLLSPGDAYQVGLCVCLQFYFLHRGCQPASAGASLHAQENICLLGYALGTLLLVYGVPSGESSSRNVVLFSLCLADYLLWLGHTWDRAGTTFETVLNCRLVYVYACSAAVVALYAAWSDPSTGIQQAG